MPLFFAFSSSVFFGIADYLGGRATRETDAVGVAIRAQWFGLIAMGLVVVFRDDEWSSEIVLWGALAGVSGAVGLVLFYNALAAGQMSVAAPIAAVLGAVVPLLIGLIQGERPSLLVLVAAGIGILGVLLVSTGASGFKGLFGSGLDRPVVYAAIAGSLFGLFFVFLNETPKSSGILSVLVSRSAGLVCLALIASFAGKRAKVFTATALGITLLAGLLDGAANALAVLALHGELLSVTAVVLALYPASTLVLARLTLHERLLRSQQVGLLLAAVSVAGIAAG